MTPRPFYFGRSKRVLTQAVAILMVLVIAALGATWLTSLPKNNGNTASPGQPPLSPTDLKSIDVTPRVVELSGIKTALVTLPTIRPKLRMRGSLMLNTNRLVHVHSRFPGQVKELAIVEDPLASQPGMPTKRRTINFMDRVTEGQLLAVVWSKDLGEQKSELVDAQARLDIDRQQLAKLEELSQLAATTPFAIRDAKKQVELDEIAVKKAVNTLQAWLFTESEIADVIAVAKRVHTREDITATEKDPTWARVDVIAPMSGTIVEKNVAKGNLVDTNTDLFKIADLSVLTAFAHIYDDDLPYLQKLPRPVHWTITINSDPDAGEIPGIVEWIGDIIDPNEHMALVAGPVDNPKGDYRAGQMITATVELPAEQNTVEVPTRALVEDGDESVVLVQADPTKNEFTRRRVFVTRRYHDFVHLRSKLKQEQKDDGFEELHEGERVVSAGALELKEALMKQQGAAVSPQPEKGDRTPENP